MPLPNQDAAEQIQVELRARGLNLELGILDEMYMTDLSASTQFMPTDYRAIMFPEEQTKLRADYNRIANFHGPESREALTFIDKAGPARTFYIVFNKAAGLIEVGGKGYHVDWQWNGGPLAPNMVTWIVDEIERRRKFW